MRLARHSYATIRSVQGPLLFLERVLEARMGEVVRITFPDGPEAGGGVLKNEGAHALSEGGGGGGGAAPLRRRPWGGGRGPEDRGRHRADRGRRRQPRARHGPLAGFV